MPMTDPNDVFRQYLEERPLLDFSVYTNTQIERLNKLASEINGMMTQRRDAQVFSDIYGSFWLWVLGAYEVVRTMAQARSSFVPEVTQRLKDYKRKIANIRMPFAKQEYQGRNRPIFNEASMSGMNTQTGDMFFTIEGVQFSSMSLMKEFRDLMVSIKATDILKRHDESYNQ